MMKMMSMMSRRIPGKKEHPHFDVEGRRTTPLRRNECKANEPMRDGEKRRWRWRGRTKEFLARHGAGSLRVLRGRRDKYRALFGWGCTYQILNGRNGWTDTTRLYRATAMMMIDMRIYAKPEQPETIRGQRSREMNRLRPSHSTASHSFTVSFLFAFQQRHLCIPSSRLLIPGRIVSDAFERRIPPSER